MSTPVHTAPASALPTAETLRPLLEHTVVDGDTGTILFDEVQEIINAVEASRQGTNQRTYAVAQVSGDLAVGLMGLKLPDETMRGFARTNRPIEVINAFVDPHYRGAGIGTLLLRYIEDAARQNGFTEIVVNSGPRYRETGWPFWIKRYGSAIGKADDYYGPGIHAPVWRKVL